MAFQLLHVAPTYQKNDGTLNTGGKLKFYVTGTTTPKNVYSDEGTTVSLGNEITLDDDGRHSETIWLKEDEEYRVVCVDSADVTLWTKDNVRSVDTSVSADLPAAEDGADGDVLLTDGTPGGWYFQALRAIPDPTGHAAEWLTTDGTDWFWDSLPEADEVTEVTVTPGSSGTAILGGVMIQWGSDTAPTSANTSTTKAVTFGTAFSGTPYHIGVTPVLSSGVSSNSPSGYPTVRYSSPSTSGFTAGFFVGEENTGGTDSINATIPFTYVAYGPAPTV